MSLTAEETYENSQNPAFVGRASLLYHSCLYRCCFDEKKRRKKKKKKKKAEEEGNEQGGDLADGLDELERGVCEDEMGPGQLGKLCRLVVVAPRGRIDA